MSETILTAYPARFWDAPMPDGRNIRMCSTYAMAERVAQRVATAKTVADIKMCLLAFAAECIRNHPGQPMSIDARFRGARKPRGYDAARKAGAFCISHDPEGATSSDA